MTVSPLHLDLVNNMSNLRDNDISKVLVNEYQWDVNDAKKIWNFGPEGNEETNMLVDVTKGAQYLHEIKEHVNSGFQWVCNVGVLMEEPLRGVRFNLHDVMLHADAIHRGAGQLLPASRRVMYACMLTGQPAIMEPIYAVEIQVPDNHIGTIYNCLSHKRG